LSNYPQYFANAKVLEVGSHDINGSNRILFQSCDYTGIDIAEGYGVDAVAKCHEWQAPDGTYDTIISTECFEHDMYYAESLQKIARLLKPGGLFVFTCATTGRPEHGTLRSEPGSSPLTCGVDTWNMYYKNLTEQDITSAIDIPNIFCTYYFEVQPKTHDLYFYGIKSFS
jgi:SAM-dependent methyltransferase